MLYHFNFIGVMDIDSPEIIPKKLNTEIQKVNHNRHKLNDKRQIINLIEKPKKFVSDLAVIGIYYFKEIQTLKNYLKEYINKNLKKGEEYQINDGILQMIKSGIVFKTNTVNKWMDCGNPEATVDTNKELLEIKLNEGLNLRDPSSELINPQISCFVQIRPKK